ncbi:hypothetical protein [Chamaesiphon minutus]|nr:hypothetical protein [Chamaesiphon minutus]
MSKRKIGKGSMDVTIEQLRASTISTTGDLEAANPQIAIDPNTNPQLLRKIATASNWELRRLVASNPNTPTDALWQLGIDFPEAVLNNPVFEILQIEQLQLAAEIPHATLTSLLQCDCVPRNLMEYAVDRQDYSLWLAVAYNPQTPSTLLENLARKSRRQDRELIRAVAAHPNAPQHLLAEIIDISESVAQVVAENAKTSLDVLTKILKKYAQANDPTFPTLVALHPLLSAGLLMQMYLAPSEAAARSLWLAKQITTESTQLVELAHTDWTVLRLAVVRHPNTPSTTIEQIWDRVQLARIAHTQMDRLIYDSFAVNSNTSTRIRSELRKLLTW